MEFTESEKLDVTKHVTKKGKFNYLSWPFAVSEFRRAYPNGTWSIKSFGMIEQPYCQTDSGCFVIVTVCPDVEIPNVNFRQVHPVLNHSNKTVMEPNAFEVNTSIQRCLVKAIALATGIGLHIYAGEDLPPGDDPPEDKPAMYNEMLAELDKCKDGKQLSEWWKQNSIRVGKLSDVEKKNLVTQFTEYKEIFARELEEADNGKGD